MHVDDLAKVLTRSSSASSSGVQRQSELGFHQGVVVEWNSASGTNLIDVAGGRVPDVTVLTTTDSVLMRPGDVVGVLRFRSTYFVLGQISTPNLGRSFDVQSDDTGSPGSTTSSDLADLTNPTFPGLLGPQVTTFVGSSRRVMIFAYANITSTNNTGIFAAQIITPTPGNQFATTGLTTHDVVPTSMSLGGFSIATAGDGLLGNTDVTFMMKYQVIGGGSATFVNQRLIAWPF